MLVKYGKLVHMYAPDARKVSAKDWKDIKNYQVEEFNNKRLKVT